MEQAHDVDVFMRQVYPPTVFYIMPCVFWNRDDFGAMLPVQHQGNTKSCTAFAIVTIMYFRILKQHKLRCKLSPQQIADRFSLLYNGERPTEGRGIDFDDAIPYVRDYGLLLERDYPWRGTMQRFVMPNRPVDIFKGKFERIREHQFQDHLYASPILSAIYVASEYEEWEASGRCIDEIYIPGRPSGERLTGHAVVVVGFGCENGQNYYIVQDSHGRDHNRGFKKISRRMFKYGYLATSVDIFHEQWHMDDAYFNLANCSI